MINTSTFRLAGASAYAFAIGLSTASAWAQQASETSAMTAPQDAGATPVPAAEAAQAPTASPSTDDLQAGVAAIPVAPEASPAAAAREDDATDVPTKKKRKKKARGRQGQQAAREAGQSEADVTWGDPWGDSQDELRAAGLSFKFLMQTHYRQTFAYSSNNPDPAYRLPEETLVRQSDGWDLNRLFFRIAAEPSKYLGLKIITDFAEFAHKNGAQAIKQAYADIRPIPKHLHFLVGVLKLPYSITELDPVAAYEFTKMPLSNDLTKGLGFAGRDIGAEVLVTPLSKPRYLGIALGTFRGHANKEQGALFGEFGARVVTEPLKGLRFGVDWSVMPKTVVYLNPFGTGSTSILPNPENPNFPRSRTWDKGQAVSADATFYRSGFMLRSEGLLGTRVDHDTQYGANKFGAFWAIAAYRFPLGPVELQPGLRAEWLDTDLGRGGGLRRQFAASVATYVTKSVRLLLDIQRTIVQAGSPELQQPLPLREIPYEALSNTSVAGQVQIVL